MSDSDPPRSWLFRAFLLTLTVTLTLAVIALTPRLVQALL